MTKTIKYGGGFVVVMTLIAVAIWLTDTFGYLLGGVFALMCLGFVAKFYDAYKAAAIDHAALTLYTDIRQIKGLSGPTLGASYCFDLEAVGEASYKARMQRLIPKQIRDSDSFRVYALMTLQPETENPHDKNAVAIHLAGLPVAYLAREDALRYRKKYDDAAHTVWGVIVGGKGKTAGVWLDVTEGQLG